MAAPKSVYSNKKLNINNNNEDQAVLIALPFKDYEENYNSLANGIKNWFSVDEVIPISDEGFIGVCGKYWEDSVIRQKQHYKFHKLSRISKIRLYNEEYPYKEYIVFNDGGLNTYPIIQPSISLGYSNYILANTNIRSSFFSTTRNIRCIITREGAPNQSTIDLSNNFISLMPKVTSEFKEYESGYLNDLNEQPEGNNITLSITATNDEGTITETHTVKAQGALSPRQQATFLVDVPDYLEDLESGYGAEFYMWNRDYNRIKLLSESETADSYIAYRDIWLNNKSNNNWSNAGYFVTDKVEGKHIIYKVLNNGRIVSRLEKELSHYTRYININIVAETTRVNITASWRQDILDKYKYDAKLYIPLESVRKVGTSISTGVMGITWENDSYLELVLPAYRSNVSDYLSYIYDAELPNGANAIRIKQNEVTIEDNDGGSLFDKPTELTYTPEGGIDIIN